MTRTIQAIILIIALQLSWTRVVVKLWSSPDGLGMAARRVAVGFPLHSVFFARAKASKDWVPALSQAEYGSWTKRFRVDLLHLQIDSLVAVALFFGCRWLLRFRAANIVFTAISMNLVLLSIILLQSWIEAAVSNRTHGWLNVVADAACGLTVLLGGPLIVCWLTRRENTMWSAFAIVAFFSLLYPWTISWPHQFGIFQDVQHYWYLAGRGGGVTEFPPHWPSDYEAVVFPILLTGFLVLPVFLMRRFLPGLRPQPHDPLPEKAPSTS